MPVGIIGPETEPIWPYLPASIRIATLLLAGGKKMRFVR